MILGWSQTKHALFFELHAICMRIERGASVSSNSVWISGGNPKKGTACSNSKSFLDENRKDHARVFGFHMSLGWKWKETFVFLWIPYEFRMEADRTRAFLPISCELVWKSKELRACSFLTPVCFFWDVNRKKLAWFCEFYMDLGWKSKETRAFFFLGFRMTSAWNSKDTCAFLRIPHELWMEIEGNTCISSKPMWILDGSERNTCVPPNSIWISIGNRHK